MAMRPHMFRHPKSAVWYYRRAIPPHLRPYLPAPHTGKSELLQSLGQKDKALADREHIRVAEVMERILDQARRAHLKANQPETAAQPLTPYEQALLAMGEEDGFDIRLDMAALPAGMRSAPTFSPSTPPPADHTTSPSNNAKYTIKSVYCDYERELKLSQDIKREYLRTITYFTQHAGLSMDAPIDATTKEMIHNFNLALIEFPKSTRAKSLKNKTFQQLIDYANANGKARIADASRQKHIAALSALFKYAVSRGRRIDDPTFGITVKVNKSKAKRMPYSERDLSAIFSSDIFKETHWTHIQWLPILALYTGARLEELGSLRVADIKEERGIHFIAIRETDDDGNFISSVKTDESTRNVPIHPKLIELGFLEHVKNARANGDFYLFQGLSEKSEKRTATFSNWWSRRKKAFSITGNKKTFHSFRHSFKDACREAEIEESIHDELTGHTNGSTGRYYGKGHPLRILFKNIKKIEYPLEINRSNSPASE